MIGPIITTCIGAGLFIAFSIFRDKKSSKLAILLKGLTSLMFLLTAIISMVVLVNKGTKMSNALPVALLIGGLFAGLIGDITLDFKTFFKARGRQEDSDDMMTIGMFAFGLGHVFYIVSLFLRYKDLVNPYLFIALAISAVLAAAIILISKFVLKMDFGKFLIHCISYAFLLSCFLASSFFIMIKGGVKTFSVVTFIGSVLFIISDLILSMTYFSSKEKYEIKGIMNPESRFMIVINHLTYYGAQFLIALSILFM